MTIVKVEVGKSAVHWEHWEVISQQTHREHLVCAPLQASPRWRVMELKTDISRPPGMQDSWSSGGLQERLANPNNSS